MENKQYATKQPMGIEDQRGNFLKGTETKKTEIQQSKI